MRRLHITRDDLFDFARQLASLDPQVDLDRPFERSFEQILALAVRRQLSTYDASYLELAQRLALPIATADGNLSQAAREVRVECSGRSEPTTSKQKKGKSEDSPFREALLEP
jgi:predicted nucleic acid-binding protein